MLIHVSKRHPRCMRSIIILLIMPIHGIGLFIEAQSICILIWIMLAKWYLSFPNTLLLAANSQTIASNYLPISVTISIHGLGLAFCTIQIPNIVWLFSVWPELFEKQQHTVQTSPIWTQLKTVHVVMGNKCILLLSFSGPSVQNVMVSQCSSICPFAISLDNQL